MDGELWGFVKFEYCVKLPNQFYIAERINSKVVFLTDGIDKHVHTIVDTKGSQGRIMNKLKWDD